MKRDSDPKDRRSHPRSAVDGVRGSFLLSADATVLNLSVDGMAIETHSPLKVGRAYSLKLNQAERTIPLVGKVVWCSLVKTQRSDDGEVVPIYRAGVHFEDILQGTAADLQKFIASNAVVSLEQRLFGRFRLDRRRDASVECEAEFHVLQLSLAGMLIETDTAPPIDSVHEMEIRFAEVGFETRVRIAHVAEVEREDPEAGRLYRLGVQFLGLAPRVRAQLEEFILSETT